MKKNVLKIPALLVALGLVLVLSACDLLNGDDGGDGNGNGNGNGGDGIDWDSEDGTLTVINNTAKDMVIFQGQTPSASKYYGRG